jgi:hypothetical protein
MPHLIRSAALSNYVEMVRAAGLDPYRTSLISSRYFFRTR